MSKTIALIANVKVLKPLSDVLEKKGYTVTIQLPVLTLPITNQLKENPPDIIFISEEVECDDDLTIIQTIGLIKEKVNPRFIVQTRPRSVGDPLLSDLVSLAVYDFITSNQFEVSELINRIENPRQYPEVKDYHNLTRRVIDLPLPELPNREVIEPLAQPAKDLKKELYGWLKKPLERIIKVPLVKQHKPDDESKNIKVATKNITPKPRIDVDISTTSQKPIPPKVIKPSTTNEQKSLEVIQKAPSTGAKVNNINPKRGITNKLITVVCNKPRVGCTTVALNLLRFGGILVTADKFEKTIGLNIVNVENPQEIEQALEQLKVKHNFIVADLGNHHSTNIYRQSDVVIIVTDNHKDSIDRLELFFEHIPRDKAIIAVNKAIPSGLPPKNLSSQFKVPLGIVIPFQNGYKENFGLNLSIDPWKILIEKHLK